MNLYPRTNQLTLNEIRNNLHLQVNMDELVSLFSRNNIGREYFNLQILVDYQPQTEYSTPNGTAIILNNNTDYQIRLFNNWETRCDVDLSIDGQDVGIFRVEAGDFAVVERPTKINKKFTFVQDENILPSPDGFHHKYGLITAVFKPELPGVPQEENFIYAWKKKEDEIDSLDLSSMSISSNYYVNPRDVPSSQNVTYGRTLMQKQTDQTFKVVPYIKFIDKRNITTINIMLFVSPSN